MIVMERRQAQGRPRWVVERVLARSRRYWEGSDAMEALADWSLRTAEMGIRAVIHLLSESELRAIYGNHRAKFHCGCIAAEELFLKLQGDYASPQQSFLEDLALGGLAQQICFLINDCDKPSLDKKQLLDLQMLFSTVPRPILVHCGSIDRTGMLDAAIWAFFRMNQASAPYN